MKTAICLTAVLLALSSALPVKARAHETPALLWQVTDGLQNPESAYYDAASRKIFVSNVAGDPSAKDGNGWISRIALDGQVLDARFFEGLNAPKGLRSFRDTLWVADIDRLVGISISKAVKTYEFTIPEAKFLNDVAVDGRGNVYVSDFTGNKIYKASFDGKTWQQPVVILEGESLLENPNGLLVVGSKLVIGRWGLGIKPDFSTETPGGLVVKQGSTDVLLPLTEDFANIDGIESLGRGRFLVSDFVKGTLYKIERDGSTEVLLQDKPGAADIGLVPQKRILLLPNLNDNSLKAYQL